MTVSIETLVVLDEVQFCTATTASPSYLWRCDGLVGPGHEHYFVRVV